MREGVLLCVVFAVHSWCAPIETSGNNFITRDTNKNYGTSYDGLSMNSDQIAKRTRRDTFLNDEDLRARLQQSANIARAMASMNEELTTNDAPVDGKMGPGKLVGVVGENGIGELFYRKTRPDSRLGTDTGYGSRISAGSNLANDLVALNLYGSYGPGRRKRALSLDDVIRVQRLYKRFVSDGGFGSRVGAGSNLANSLVARHLVYGNEGPGK